MSSNAIFEHQVALLAEAAHGVPQLAALTEHMKGLDKNARATLIESYFCRKPISWQFVKEQIWDTEQKRADNKFHFLQGDVIETSMVQGIGSAASASTHDLWLVLSPDCDCVRSKYVLVAPIYEANRDTNPEQFEGYKNRYVLSLTLGTLKYFPVGKDLFEQGAEGFFADLTEPYFLPVDAKDTVVIHFSMQKYGWHILSALLKHRDTRAVDRQEGERLRDSEPEPEDEPAETAPV